MNGQQVRMGNLINILKDKRVWGIFPVAIVHNLIDGTFI